MNAEDCSEGKEWRDSHKICATNRAIFGDIICSSVCRQMIVASRGKSK